MEEYIHPDVIGLPPDRYLSAAAKKAVKAREEAWGKWVDLESDHIDMLQSNWQRVADDMDRRAGAEAARAGKDPLSVPSTIEKWAADRPRVIGALNALAAEVRLTNKAAVAAVTAELPAIEAKLRAESDAAAERYVQAQMEADKARGEYGAAIARRKWAVNRMTEEQRYGGFSFPEQTDGVTPKTYRGHDAKTVHGVALRGAAEVNHVERTLPQLPESAE